MSKTAKRESKCARALIERLVSQGRYKGKDFSGILTLEHYSFSRNQKSIGAWAWAMLQDGKYTGLDSSVPIRELLRQEHIYVLPVTGEIA